MARFGDVALVVGLLVGVAALVWAHLAIAALPFGAGSDRPVGGLIAWRELHAGEWKGAFDFYSKLFGWRKGEAIDMGPGGTYQLFVVGEGPAGGMLTKQPAEAHPYWMYYFNVKGINAAAKRVKDNKGEVSSGPHQVPGGSWIIHCRDPQGAIFALVSPEA